MASERARLDVQRVDSEQLRNETMSVTTTADEKLHEARQHIADAIRSLSAIVIDECWGHDDFSKEYRNKIDTAFESLRQAKRDLAQ